MSDIKEHRQLELLIAKVKTEFFEAFEQLYRVFRNPNLNMLSVRKWIRETSKVFDPLDPQTRLHVGLLLDIIIRQNLGEIYTGHNKEDFLELIRGLMGAVYQTDIVKNEADMHKAFILLETGKPDPACLPDYLEPFSMLKPTQPTTLNNHWIIHGRNVRISK